MNYNLLFQKLVNVPLAMDYSAAKKLKDQLMQSAINQKTYYDEDTDHYTKNKIGLINGVAVIKVSGVLVDKDPYWYGVTGYDWIRSCLKVALDDNDVRAVVLDIESPGGDVSGCFDLVDAIYSARGNKPIWAILSEYAYSAAYAIASACDKVIVPRTGGTGSVGVICMHADISEALKKFGVNVTLITYGQHKADGNEYNPLDDAAKAKIQADTDFMGDLFVKTVARNRGLPFEKVKATQAATFLGGASVANGFADAVMPPDKAFSSLLAELD